MTPDNNCCDPMLDKTARLARTLDTLIVSLMVAILITISLPVCHLLVTGR